MKKGIPVEVRTNSSADAGCVSGLMIPDFDINKALDVGQDSFTFVPDKAGTFEFTCEMRMSSSTLTVI
ncbi:plastocyanin domain-containing protein [Peptococcaceae bacterium DYL19]|nr:plastocyanin domain-containing protein [Phosphitispora fastidiosa]